MDKKTPKVEVLRRGIESLGLDCRVEPVAGNILDRDVLARPREPDILIGCVDKAFPRQLLCEFAYRYHRPYIDKRCFWRRAAATHWSSESRKNG